MITYEGSYELIHEDEEKRLDENGNPTVIRKLTGLKCKAAAGSPVISYHMMTNEGCGESEYAKVYSCAPSCRGACRGATSFEWALKQCTRLCRGSCCTLEYAL